MYETHSAAKDAEALTNIKETVQIPRIRAGHSTAFESYRHLMDESDDPVCQPCKEAPGTVEHCFQECAQGPRSRSFPAGPDSLMVQFINFTST